MTKAQDQKDERDAAQTAERERIERESAAEKSAAEIERNNQQAMTGRKTAAPAVDQPQTDSAARLRAFEDEVFGKRAVRIDGKIERGVGSPYANMTDERKAQYAALEALVVAEQKLNDATAAVGAAEAERVAAEERLALADKTAQEKTAAAEADKAEAEKAAAQDKARVAG